MRWQQIVVGSLPAIITPLVVVLWKRLAPPRRWSRIDDLGWSTLSRRNVLLDHLFTLLMFVGLITPLTALFVLKIKPTDPKFLIGLGCVSLGSMIFLPVLAVVLITLPSGRARLREFWRFYEKKWGIGLNGIAWVYVPIASLLPVGLILMLSGI